MTSRAGLIAALRDPVTRPRAVLMLSLACALTVSVAWPLARAFLSIGAVAAN